MIEEVKEKLIGRGLYRHLLFLRSFFYYSYIKACPVKKEFETVYCISPYKTGTTYFSGLFRCRSQHEPLMHTTITHIEDLGFLSKRASYLDLDLECSGFFADRLGLVRAFSPDAKVIFLSRHPDAWIGSVVNYFAKLNAKVSYNYVARLIFDPICKYPIENFYNLTDEQQSHVVRMLIEYWIKVYSSGLADKNSLVIPLEQLDDRLSEIEEFTGLKAKRSGAVWKRENPDKREFQLADYIDPEPFTETIRALGYEL